MTRRFRRDPVRAQIGSYGSLPVRLYKQLDGDVRFPFDAIGWWTYVGLRGAAAGAAVMLGAYRALFVSRTAASEYHRGALGSGAASEFARLVNHRRAMAPSYRVVAWAYMSEMTAELWAPQYEAEMEEAASALLPLSRYEAQVRELGSTLLRTAGGPEQQREQLEHFRREVFHLMLTAATRPETAFYAPSPAPAATPWLDAYRNGRQIAVTRVRQLAPKEVPVLLDS